ncbi:MAG: hypothetical protein LBG17_03840 [Bacteroidales bacterium]|jgi:hypothetical protein|nr:hypothetical protein [Bacteroidales bacterium]
MKKLLIAFLYVFCGLCSSCSRWHKRTAEQENFLFDISYKNIVSVEIDSGGTAFTRGESEGEKQSGTHYRMVRVADSFNVVSCCGCHSSEKRISTRKAEVYLSNFGKVYFNKREPLPDSAVQWGHLKIAEASGDTVILNLYAVRGDAFGLYAIRTVNPAVRTKSNTHNQDTVVMPYAPIDRIFSPHRYFDF